MRVARCRQQRPLKRCQVEAVLVPLERACVENPQLPNVSLMSARTRIGTVYVCLGKGLTSFSQREPPNPPKINILSPTIVAVWQFRAVGARPPTQENL